MKRLASTVQNADSFFIRRLVRLSNESNDSPGRLTGKRSGWRRASRCGSAIACCCTTGCGIRTVGGALSAVCGATLRLIQPPTLADPRRVLGVLCKGNEQIVAGVSADGDAEAAEVEQDGEVE